MSAIQFFSCVLLVINETITIAAHTVYHRNVCLATTHLTLSFFYADKLVDADE